MFIDIVDGLVINSKQNGDYENFTMEMFRVFGIHSKIEKEEFDSLNDDSLIDKALGDVMEHYQQKMDKISRILLPFIKMFSILKVIDILR
ncbi:MAG: hypothetical protein R2771_01935 [Saprospiraceae bacterium]